VGSELPLANSPRLIVASVMASSSLFPYNLVQPMATDDRQFTGLPPLRTGRQASIDETVEHAPPPPKAEAAGKGALKVSVSRRERCRVNQARYRNRQRQLVDTLKQSIEQLKEEIEDLDNKRQRLARCTPTGQNVWVVAAEYFRVFRHGFMAPLCIPESTTGKRGQSEPSLQLDFLHQVMVSNPNDGVVCGAEALLDNWRLLSLYHNDVQLQLKRLEAVTPDSLVATATLSFTITDDTLQHVYPHLIDGHDLLPLAARLLDQRVALSGSVRFDWDKATGRVMRLESSFDLLTPMLKLLASLEDVMLVFDQACITLDGKLTM
jgi:hypothetical protein